MVQRTNYDWPTDHRLGITGIDTMVARLPTLDHSNKRLLMFSSNSEKILILPAPFITTMILQATRLFLYVSVRLYSLIRIFGTVKILLVVQPQVCGDSESYHQLFPNVFTTRTARDLFCILIFLSMYCIRDLCIYFLFMFLASRTSAPLFSHCRWFALRRPRRRLQHYLHTFLRTTLHRHAPFPSLLPPNVSSAVTATVLPLLLFVSTPDTTLVHTRPNIIIIFLNFLYFLYTAIKLHQLKIVLSFFFFLLS